MKKISRTLFTLLVILFGLSTAISSYAQVGGPPNIRKESQGGGTKGKECIQEDGNDHTITFEIVIDNLAFLDECDLNIGYDLVASDMMYVHPLMSDFIQNPLDPTEYIFDLNIVLTAHELETMCQQDNFTINIDFFCIENGINVSMTGGVGYNFQIYVCCIAQNTTSGKNSNEGNGKNVSNQQQGNEYRSDLRKILATDYTIFDLHGNQVGTIKNQSIQISPQQCISDLSIRSGMYLVRYWNGTKMEVAKVYKY